MELYMRRSRIRRREDAPKRRGFRDGVDLRLGAIVQTNARERERERENQKSSNKTIYKNIDN